MELLALSGIVQVIGICVLGYVHLTFLKRMSSDIRTIAMFKKSRTLQDLAAMKAMGLTSEDWDKEEEAIKKEEEEEEVRSVDELSDEAVFNLRANL